MSKAEILAKNEGALLWKVYECCSLKLIVFEIYFWNNHDDLHPPSIWLFFGLGPFVPEDDERGPVIRVDILFYEGLLGELEGVCDVVSFTYVGVEEFHELFCSSVVYAP